MNSNGQDSAALRGHGSLSASPLESAARDIRERLADAARLAALRSTGLVEAPPPEVLERLTRAATNLLGVPVALISLVDDEQQWFAGLSGLTGWAAEQRHTPLSHSFCQYVVAHQAPLIVNDAASHPFLHASPAIVDLSVRAYAGVPLTTASGQTLGAFCAIDTQPREWTEEQVNGLRDLAMAATSELELRIALAARRASEAWFASLIGSSTDAILTIDSKQRIVFANGAGQRLFGYTASAIAGQPLETLIPDMQRPTHGARVAIMTPAATSSRDATGAMRESIPSARLELVGRHRDGGTFPIEGSISRMTADDDSTYAVILRDISVRRQLEQRLEVHAEALRASEERYALAARATCKAIWDWNVETDTLAWAEGASEVLGSAPDGIPLATAWWNEVIHPDDRVRVIAGLHAVIVGSVLDWRDTYRIRRSDGTYVDVLDRGFVVRNWAGRATRLIGAMEDVTAQKLLEAQFLQSQKMEAIGQLAGGIAHDFNNLLTVISVNLEMVLDELSAGHSSSANIREIGDAAERARTLVRQLLLFSRKQPASARSVSVADIVRGAEQMLRRVIGEEIVLDVVIADVATFVDIDPGQLEQILMNCAVNARDAMMSGDRQNRPMGGTLSIEVDCGAGIAQVGSTPRPRVGAPWVRIAIRDTGHGMTLDTQLHAFDPFFTTKAVGSGTGLGLSTVFAIVKQAGGTVEVNSVLGLGTTFTVFLPATVPAPLMEQTPVLPGSMVHPRLSRETILLVEDENSVRQLLRRLLEREGYVVLEARHGADALQLWSERSADIDVVITDSRMPEMSGSLLAERLHADDANLPIVFMSGYSDSDEIERGGGNATFLAKPFSSAQLLSAIAMVLERRSVGATQPTERASAAAAG